MLKSMHKLTIRFYSQIAQCNQQTSTTQKEPVFIYKTIQTYYTERTSVHLQHYPHILHYIPVVYTIWTVELSTINFGMVIRNQDQMSTDRAFASSYPLSFVDKNVWIVASSPCSSDTCAKRNWSINWHN